MVPCVTAPVTVTLQNFGDKCISIPKYAEVGEVYLVHPLRYSGYDGDDDDESSIDPYGDMRPDPEEPLKGEEEVEVCACGVAWTVHEVSPHYGAEIKTQPLKPPLQVLPDDLQKLLDRSSKNLSEKQKES